MILVLTNADTEILALRSVIEGLPEGFPEVRFLVTPAETTLLKAQLGKEGYDTAFAWDAVTG